MLIFRRLSFVLFLSLVWNSPKAQKATATSEAIVKIRKAYQQINGYKKYKTVVIDDTVALLGNETDNGASLTGYYKQDTLKKMVEWVGLSSKVIQNEYYFEADKLIFVYSVESNYHFNDSSQTFDYTKLDRAVSGRYYFNNEKLINAILTGTSNASVKEDAAALLQDAKKYKVLLRTHSKA